MDLSQIQDIVEPTIYSVNPLLQMQVLLIRFEFEGHGVFMHKVDFKIFKPT